MPCNTHNVGRKESKVRNSRVRSKIPSTSSFHLSLRVLVNGLVRSSSLLLLVIELSFAEHAGTTQSDQHAHAVKEVDIDVEHDDAERNGHDLLQVAADGHGEGTSKLVGVEGGDVEKEGEETVSAKSENGGDEGHLLRAHVSDEAGDFTSDGGARKGLHGGKRRHAHEELDGGQGQRASHESVGDNGLKRSKSAGFVPPGAQAQAYLDSGKNHAEDGKEESGVREAHLAGSSHGGADDEGEQGRIGHGAVSAAIPDAVEEDGEHRAKHTHSLVERYRDHGERKVGNGNVGSEEGAERDQGEILTSPQPRQLKVAHLHHHASTEGGERGVKESQEPWEVELDMTTD